MELEVDGFLVLDLLRIHFDLLRLDRQLLAQRPRVRVTKLTHLALFQQAL